MKYLKALFRRVWAAFPVPCEHVEVTLDANGRVFLAENLTTTYPAQITGEWGEPEPHPVPRFSKTHKIQRQPIAVICHCHACGAWFVQNGFNQRDYDDRQIVLPFPDQTKKSK